MSDILFYHLERSRLEAVLPDLLQKTLQKGWQATVRTGSSEAMSAIDEMLWTYADESFLPHGTDGDGANHPVWITDQNELKPGAELLFLVEGGSTEISDLAGLERCILIFDGADETAVSSARDFWKEAKEAAHNVTYWKQSAAGKWEKQG
jgi:DNA polymerase-3 subunit chi